MVDLKHACRERLGDFSAREKHLWFELLVDIGVALYYYPKAFHLLMAGDGALSGEVMTDLVVNTVMLAIGLSIALAILLHMQDKPEPKDERDYMIEARSNGWYSRFLIGGVMAVMGVIVMQEFTLWPGDWFVATPLVLAHLLLLVLMLASMLNSILKLLMYRTGL